MTDARVTSFCTDSALTFLTTPARMFCSVQEANEHLQANQATMTDLVLAKCPISGAHSLVLLVLEIERGEYLLNFVRPSDDHLFAIVRAHAFSGTGINNLFFWGEGRFPVEAIDPSCDEKIPLPAVMSFTPEQKLNLDTLYAERTNP